MSKILVIIDPWKSPLETDVENYPQLPALLSAEQKLLASILPTLETHFDGVYVQSGEPVCDSLKHLPKLIKHNIKPTDEVVFCGWHYARCIPKQIVDINKQYKIPLDTISILRNYSFMFPGDTPDKIKDYYEHNNYPIVREIYFNNHDYFYEQ